MPRVFSQSLQTAGKAADTAEVDIDKHFLQFSDCNIFLPCAKRLIASTVSLLAPHPQLLITLSTSFLSLPHLHSGLLFSSHLG